MFCVVVCRYLLRKVQLNSVKLHKIKYLYSIEVLPTIRVIYIKYLKSGQYSHVVECEYEVRHISNFRHNFDTHLKIFNIGSYRCLKISSIMLLNFHQMQIFRYKCSILDDNFPTIIKLHFSDIFQQLKTKHGTGGSNCQCNSKVLDFHLGVICLNTSQVIINWLLFGMQIHVGKLFQNKH